MQHPWDRRLGVWWIAEDHPDLPAIVHSPSGRTPTFGELAAAAHRLAHGLRARGIGAGDIVAYVLPNDVDAVLWPLATSEIGVRYLSLNPSLSEPEFHSILRHSGAKVVVTHPDYADRLGDLDTLGTVVLRITVGQATPGFETQDELCAGQPADEPAERSLGGPIRYSSGTTGKPKGIVRAVPKTEPSVAADAMSSFGRAFGFLPLEGVHLVSTGMHHGGCQGFYLGALNVGQALAITGRFDAERTLALIDRYSVTTAYMVPTQFVRMLRLPEEVRARYRLDSLSSVVHSAAPCPVQVKKEMFDWWGPVLWETYGGMEGAATIAKPHRWLEKPGTVGRAIRGMSVRILDDEGHDLPAGEIGHVYLEPAGGPGFEYRGDPELTRSVRRGAAFTIGDIGYLDDDGYLFICDRAKDMIISGGVNIYPAEIEGVLSAHPAVGDVAVFGVPDPEWGEQVKAVVEPVEGFPPSHELGSELIAYSRERLAGYKCPRTIEFADALPRTETGKLLKRVIRDKYWADSGRNV
ncbi:AMP-binding protein [Nocardia higoensis]|uniref:AMP-binding protein n=1 Tax=Nocardia higoensis TaxID=228599 RepID=UPI0002ECBEA3|nr:AMP-binding protein [Nocardia higoensis]